MRYDPEYLNEMVALYEVTTTGEKRFIAHAEPKRKHEVVPALMREGAKEKMLKDMEVRELEYQRDLKAYEELQRKTGINPETIIEQQELMVKMQGNLPKKEQMKVDSESIYSRY